MPAGEVENGEVSKQLQKRTSVSLFPGRSDKMNGGDTENPARRGQVHDRMMQG